MSDIRTALHTLADAIADHFQTWPEQPEIASAATTAPDPAPEPEPEPEPEVAEVAVGIQDVRRVLAERAKEGKSPKVRELLRAYGATKLTEVAEDQLASLLAEAEALASA